MLSAILPHTRPFGISTCRYGQNGAGFCECGYIHIERAVLYIVDKTKRTARIEPYVLEVGCKNQPPVKAAISPRVEDVY